MNGRKGKIQEGKTVKGVGQGREGEVYLSVTTIRKKGK